MKQLQNILALKTLLVKPLASMVKTITSLAL